VLDYNVAVRQGTAPGDGMILLILLKAGNRVLESIGFMMQRAPRRLLPTGHHSNDLVPLPTSTIPDDDAVLRNIA